MTLTRTEATVENRNLRNARLVQTFMRGLSDSDLALCFRVNRPAQLHGCQGQDERLPDRLNSGGALFDTLVEHHLDEATGTRWSGMDIPAFNM